MSRICSLACWGWLFFSCTVSWGQTSGSLSATSLRNSSPSDGMPLPPRFAELDSSANFGSATTSDTGLFQPRTSFKTLTLWDGVGGNALPPTQSQLTSPSQLGEVTKALLPPGSYPSPYYSDSSGCCSPLGRHGCIGYEVYTYTGPNLPFGSSDFAGRLNTGWVVGGGGRTLFFNPTHDAAWVLDLGLSYTYNRGEQESPVFLDIRQPPRSDPLTGRAIPQPDLYTLSAIRGLHRTNFNFALGRDWWLWGPAANGLQEGWNLRIGGQVGGRWGTAHVDVVPLNQVNGYARRQNVTHGFFLAAHSTLEVPFGGCILFGGLRVEWGYDWTNIVPPLNGDLNNVNLLLTAGIRF